MFFLSDMLNKKLHLPKPGQALGGRDTPVRSGNKHFVNKRPMKGPYPEGFAEALFGMGCYWGAERLFWQMPGVWVTSVGFAGGETPNPTYQETCTGMTGHAEVVHVVFDPKAVSFAELLATFWESHDPTQGMRQGNDVGTTYRSVIFTFNEAMLKQAEASRAAYQAALTKAGKQAITTEIAPAPAYYLAEEDHQQYLAKNPGGYCGLKGTGVACALPSQAV